ncbi:MAG: hypothetical protein IJR59_06555 [Firmicutes bacterium]|nr:hypothetical protein [Bacillota bacterium]
MKKRYFVLLTGLLTTASMSLGYFLYRSEAEEPAQRISITPERPAVLSEDAVLEYVYKYAADNITEITEAPLPPYLVGLTESEVREKMSGFAITRFSPDKVTAVKRLNGESRQHYTLGEYNGYLAVYYKKGGGLKEITNTPVTSLSDDEKKLLVTTEIVGSDKLARLLEDIES